MDFSIVGIWWWYVFKFAFGEVTDLFFPSWECLQIYNMKVNLLYSTHLALCIPLFLGKGTNNRDKGCLECVIFLTCWRHRTKLAIFVSIPRLRSIWGQNPWPTRADDEPQHELRVRIPANQSEAFPLCQVGDSVFLTGTCTWEPSAWGDPATPCSEGTSVLH